MISDHKPLPGYVIVHKYVEDKLKESGFKYCFGSTPDPSWSSTITKFFGEFGRCNVRITGHKGGAHIDYMISHKQVVYSSYTQIAFNKHWKDIVNFEIDTILNRIKFLTSHSIHAKDEETNEEAH